MMMAERQRLKSHHSTCSEVDAESTSHLFVKSVMAARTEPVAGAFFSCTLAKRQNKIGGGNCIHWLLDNGDRHFSHRAARKISMPWGDGLQNCLPLCEPKNKYFSVRFSTMASPWHYTVLYVAGLKEKIGNKNLVTTEQFPDGHLQIGERKGLRKQSISRMSKTPSTELQKARRKVVNTFWSQERLLLGRRRRPSRPLLLTTRHRSWMSAPKRPSSAPFFPRALSIRIVSVVGAFKMRFAQGSVRRTVASQGYSRSLARGLASGPSAQGEGFFSSVMRFVDPHRVTALELDRAMREMETKLDELRDEGRTRSADSKAEASRAATLAVAELEEKLERTSKKKATEEKMAKRRELPLGLAALVVSLFLGWESVVWSFLLR
jgi:hypothetical protein